MSDATWEKCANAIIHGGWHYNSTPPKDPYASVKSFAPEQISMVLLLDIAKSLRILRCKNFTAIPHILKSLEHNTRRKVKRRKRAKKP